MVAGASCLKGSGWVCSGPGRAELPADLGLGIGPGRTAHHDLQRPSGQALVDVDRGFDGDVRPVGAEPPAPARMAAQQDRAAIPRQRGLDPRLQLEAHGIGGGDGADDVLLVWRWMQPATGIAQFETFMENGQMFLLLPDGTEPMTCSRAGDTEPLRCVALPMRN